MSAAQQSRWSRRYVAVSAVALVGAYLLALIDAPRNAIVGLALFGFIFHAIFGKAYALVPTYFGTELGPTAAPAVQFPLTVLGSLAIVWHDLGAPPGAALVGVAGWLLGVCIFLGIIFWTIRGNLSGHTTATGDHNAHRRRLDRFANAVVPIALGYLLVGSVGLAATVAGLPWPVGGGRAVVHHLLAVGTAVTLLMGIGFRLLPRLATGTPPRNVGPVVLVCGALGPAFLAVSFPTGVWFRVGAVLEAVAVGGFALAVLSLLAGAQRARTGMYAVAIGAIAGLTGIGLGLVFAFDLASRALASAHLRLNLLGLLGLSIVGVTLQLYPPNVGSWPACSERTAGLAVGAMAGGLAFQAVGLGMGFEIPEDAGEALGVVGAGLFLYLYLGALAARS